MFLSVIFDMNGVIIDDERVHQESWRRFCAKHGFHLSEEEFKHNVFGRTEAATLRYLFKKDVPPQDLDSYLNERVATAIELFKPRLAPSEGIIDLLIALRQDNVPLAIATSSRRPYASFILDSLALRQYFDVIVTAEDIERGKPDPEIYLRAARELAADPACCVVFEDSLSGIDAARAAGMRVIGVATTHRVDELDEADIAIPSFAGFDSSAILSLVE